MRLSNFLTTSLNIRIAADQANYNKCSILFYFSYAFFRLQEAIIAFQNTMNDMDISILIFKIVFRIF